MATRETHEFGDFRLDSARRRLETKDGENVALNAKVFDALVYLVEHAGEPVSRKALIEGLWPKRVVEENNLTQAISALRRALGEGYIVTLAGRGYQFVAEVRSVRADSDSVPPGPSETAPADTAASAVAAPPSGPASMPTRRGSRARRGIAVAGGVALAAILAVWGYFSMNPAEEPRPTGGGAPAVKVLVLPFDSPSTDSDQRAFSDGLTDELIIRLQQLSGLRVTGRTTSFALRDSERSGPNLAAELGVQYVLEGSVGRDGDRLRIRGQLSDASGFSVWAESYDRSLASIFEIQDEIVSAIAAELRATLGLDRALQRSSTQDFEAYQLYLQARSAAGGAQGVTRESYARPFALVDRALQLDPQFATAWMLKSKMHSIVSASLAEGRAVELAAAEEAALHAIALAPHQGDGYSARAMLLGIRGEWRNAERDYGRARELGFNDIAPYSILLLSAGHLERGHQTAAELLETDPLNAGLYGFLMLSHEMLGDTEAADAVYERGRVLFDPWVVGGNMRSWVLLGRGNVGPVTADPSRFPEQLVELIRDRDGALATLNELARAPSYQTPNGFGTLALWSAYFGDPQLALRMLDKAVSGSASLTYVAWLPVFDDVRQLPEFKAFLVKIGLVDHWRATGWPDVCRPAAGSGFDCSVTQRRPFAGASSNKGPL